MLKSDSQGKKINYKEVSPLSLLSPFYSFYVEN